MNEAMNNGAHAANDAVATPYLLFSLDDALFGLPATAVRETLPLPAIAPLSGLSAPYVGALDLRGRTLPLLDGRALLGFAPRPFSPQDCVIVLDDGQPFGIVVGEAREVRGIAPPEVEAVEVTQDASRSLLSRSVVGVTRVEGALVQLLRADLRPPTTLAPVVNADREPPFGSNGHAPDAAQTELLQARARTLSRAESVLPHAEASPDAGSFAAFVLGDERFAVPLEDVREFAIRGSVAPVPLGPPDLLGLVNLRGEIVPLLDLRVALELPGGASSRGQIVFVECQGRARVGLAVDEVLDVLTAREPLLPSPMGARPEHVRGAMRDERGWIAVLELRKLLQDGGWVRQDGTL